MNCIIIDDDTFSRTILTRLCEGVSELEVIDTFAKPIEAIKFLNNHSIDLIFLDIHMPDFSGFDFVQTLKNPPMVVLTTSDDSLALDAFEFECIIDYLVKPISQLRFAKAITKIKKIAPSVYSETPELSKAVNTELISSKETFFVNIDRTLIKIETAEVSLIEAKGDYILIKTKGKEYKVHSTLKNVLEKLPPKYFFQVHRSYVINLSKIVDIQDNTILIEKSVVPISRSKRTEFLRRLDLL